MEVLSKGFAIISTVSCIATLWHLARFLYLTEAGLKTLNSSHGVEAAAINFMLIFIFIVQHSVMATSRTKKAWALSKFSHLERTFYILSTSLALEFMLAHWRSYPIFLWKFDETWNRSLSMISSCGWILLILQSLNYDARELFGLSQVWNHFGGKPHPQELRPAQVQALYDHMRHPFIVASMMILWATPLMTVDRMCIALGFTLYQLLANRITKQDTDYVEENLKYKFQVLRDQKPVKRTA
eukprot:TRINITY_DN4738_c0_g1_i1.p1 TRINITY_DN4738_c0_g1~~TRINITY_DN4738_c0_g1_i1.p1  ORF type:complete len:241 (+),score=25.35 TRINITY_DN4738_c0_g1_i1:48-770(+)